MRPLHTWLLSPLLALFCLSVAAEEPSAQPVVTDPPAAIRGLRLTQRALARLRIEAGWFVMGSSDAVVARSQHSCVFEGPGSAACSAELFANERPAHSVHLQAFSIDRTEVSHRAYRRCVAAGACIPSDIADDDAKLGQELQPVAAISWHDAQRYCQFVGGKLPSEAQWERAARGGSSRLFPWGQAWNTTLANYGSAAGGENADDGFAFAAPVESFDDGRSYYGVLNMAGNVAEWVADRFAGPYGEKAERVEPQGADASAGVERVVRGGSWRTPLHMLRTMARDHLSESAGRPDVGFRCAYDD